MERILVTGSAGHLGEGLMRVLREAGRDAVGLDVLASPCTDVVGSVADRDVVRAALRGVTAVVHAATLHKPHVSSHARQDFVETNVAGTLALLEESVAAGVDRVRLHQHDEHVRARARAAAGRAGGVDHRGRRARAAQHLRRDEDRGRGPVRARAPRHGAAGPRPAHVALLPGGRRPRRRAVRVRGREPQGQRAAVPARRPPGRGRRAPVRARARAARSGSAATS